MNPNGNSIKKMPPQNLEAERALLGACLLDNEAAKTVKGIISPSDFYAESHRLIYECIARLTDEAQPCDAVTVSDALKVNGDLERIGGIAYISGLLDSVPAPASAAYYANIIREKAQTRALIDAASRILAESYEGGYSANELQDIAEKVIFDVGQGRRSEALYPLHDLLDSVLDVMISIKNVGGVTGVPTFNDLDRQYLSGLQKGDLVILAARPGVGKTSMAINIAQNATAKEGKIVAVFSLEMPKEQLVQRMLCTEARVNHSMVRKGQASRQDLKRLAKAVNSLANAQMYINDTMRISISEIRSQCRKLKMEKGLDLIVIDYIQLMQAAPGQRVENRQLEVSEISRSLKAMAKELDVPVLALSQLSRQAEQKNEKPNLSHLRESGALEQDADVVLLLHKPRRGEDGEELSEEDNIKHNKSAEDVEVIIAKHRNGPTGELPMLFFSQYTLFADHTQGWVGDAEQAPPPPSASVVPPEDDLVSAAAALPENDLPFDDDAPPF